MAFEITQKWADGCSLGVRRDVVSQRETFSREINAEYGGGGGANFDYRTLEAAVHAANMLGVFVRLKYEDDFIYKTGRDTIFFEFRDDEVRALASRALRAYFGQEVIVAV